MIDLETVKNIKTILSRQVTLFGGEYGRMKSLSLTALAYFSIFFADKRKIVTNMPVKNFPKSIDIIQLLETSQFDLNNLSKIKNSQVVWDEMNNDLKSRSAMAETNKYIGQMGVGFRKDKIHLIGSLQYMRTIDIYIDDITEMKIIPGAKVTYSPDTLEDRRIRTEKNDFRAIWKCFDMKDQRNFEIEVDLTPFIHCYNTNFKPYKLIMNHKEYMDKLELKSKNKYEQHSEKIGEDTTTSIENFSTGMSEII